MNVVVMGEPSAVSFEVTTHCSSWSLSSGGRATSSLCGILPLLGSEVGMLHA